jgi:hypothetical protein
MSTIYTEEQYFRQRWLWSILLIVSLYVFYIAGSLLYTGHALLGALLICGTTLFLFAFSRLRLQTRVAADAIKVRLVPFTEQQFRFENLAKVYTREYRPLKEYGGWGMRFSAKHGDALNVSGNRGVQLEFKDGHRILIGSQRPKELERAIQANLPQAS